MAKAVGDWTGVRDPEIRDLIAGFHRLNTDEARAVFADRWIRLASDRLDDTWPALYELLRLVREKELYRNPSWNESKTAYDSFDDYFTETMKQPFETWAELEAAHHFVKDHAPELVGESLRNVVAVMAEQARKNPALTRSDAGSKGGRGNKAIDVVNSFGGNSAEYLTARIARDHPNVLNRTAISTGYWSRILMPTWLHGRRVIGQRKRPSRRRATYSRRTVL